MTLQEILKLERSKWIKACCNSSIDRWELFRLVNEPLYFAKSYITTSTKCLLCGTQFNLTQSDNRFIVNLRCECVKDTPRIMTLKRLTCFVPLEQAEIIFKEINTKKSKKMKEDRTIEFWTNKGFTQDEALLRIQYVSKTRSVRCPEYWLKKGIVDSLIIQEKISQAQRKSSKRCKEYWLNRGFSEEESTLKVKHHQTTNGIDYYEQKYGVIGKQKFDQRICQWLNSDKMKDLAKGRSKISAKLFEDIGFGRTEITVRAKTRSYRVDFKFEKKIIEFYGDYWHANPIKYSKDDFIKKNIVQDIWDRDAKKREDLVSAGYDVLVIWENDYRNKPKDALNLCRRFLNGSEN